MVATFRRRRAPTWRMPPACSEFTAPRHHTDAGVRQAPFYLRGKSLMSAVVLDTLRAQFGEGREPEVTALRHHLDASARPQNAAMTTSPGTRPCKSRGMTRH